jgi:hypothetical protein
MNTLGPICPKCQQALRYSFAFGWFNPYNFACPNCGARLRARKGSTMYFAGAAMLGLVVAGLHIWLRFSKNCSLAVVIPLDCAVGLVGLFPWQFYIWKTDTLNEK